MFTTEIPIQAAPAGVIQDVNDPSFHVLDPDTPQVLAALQAAVVAVYRSKLQEASGLTDRMHFTNALLKPLLENGMLEMTIPDKPSSSRQKYRITERGQEFLEYKK